MIVKKDHGVTLIELMIVLVIAAILVGGIYTLFMSQQRSYSVQDQVVGVQQDARAALNIMARDIRMAGFVAGAGSGTGFTDGLINTITFPGPFTYAVTPGNSNSAPDSITVVLGAQELGTVQSVAGNTITLDRAVSSSTYFAFELQPGRLYQGTVGGSNITITSAGFSSNIKIIGGKAYGVQAITYSVTPADGALRRNTGGGAQPLAGDGITTFVEDLQFAYQVVRDTTAVWYNDPATDFPAGKTAADIKMIRINIIVRTVVPDPKETGFFKPACEDRTRENTFTGCRRRVYTTEVMVRNL